MSTEIKPCPFCGSKTAPMVQPFSGFRYKSYEDAKQADYAVVWEVVCGLAGGCGAKGGIAMGTEADGIREWNRREGA